MAETTAISIHIGLRAMMTCEHLIDYVIRHIEGVLDVPEATNFHEHLQGCVSCRSRHRDLRQMVRAERGCECQICESLLADPGHEAEICGPPPGIRYHLLRTQADDAIRGSSLRDAM
ncbi:MAG: anti-sigma factor family protein [Isosphaeraceae bacterium]